MLFGYASGFYAATYFKNFCVFTVVPSEELLTHWASNIARLCDIETG